MKYNYLNYYDFEVAIDQIISQIAQGGNEYQLIVAPARGGLIPGTVLSHSLGVPLEPVVWSTRDFNEDNQWPPRLTQIIHIKQIKNILIVEDIVDSGRTVKEITVVLKDQFPDIKIDVATVVENVAQEQISVQYSGIQIDRNVDDRWVNFWWEQK